MYRTIKRFIKRIFKKLMRKGRSKYSKFLVAYILSVMPANYLTTAITTSSNLANPNQVIRVMKNTKALTSVGGLINTATGGLARPIVNGAANLAGHASKSIGSWINSDSFIKTGQDWIDSSSKWFDAGKEAAKQLASNSDSQDNSNDSNDLDDVGVASSSDKSFVSATGKFADFYRVDGQATDFIDADEMIDLIDQSSEKGIFNYGEGDELGRTRDVTSVVTWQTVDQSAGTREEFEKGSNPSGWPKKNPKVEVKFADRTYHGYFWNRSHLVADSLGGRAFRWNLITGTRGQNVGQNDQKGGMQYIEKRTIDFLKANKSQKVYYKVVPIYEGNELIPRTVEVYAFSRDGRLNVKVITYNEMPGFKINYLDGSVAKE